MTKGDRKHDRLKKDVAGLAWRIEQQFCTCGPEYTGRGLVAPDCQAHDIREYILEWLQVQR